MAGFGHFKVVNIDSGLPTDGGVLWTWEYAEINKYNSHHHGNRYLMDRRWVTIHCHTLRFFTVFLSPPPGTFGNIWGQIGLPPTGLLLVRNG